MNSRRRVPVVWTTLGALSALAVFATVSCKCNDDKAYTPFGVASEMPSASDSATPPVAPSASAGFAEKKDLLAPPNATHWKIGDVEATLPDGRVFERALAADFDGDGKQDAVAWTVPAASKPGAGAPELVYFPATGESRTLQALPGFIPTGPGCKTDVELRQTGPRTMVLDAAASCVGTTLVARSPVRGLFVIAPASQHAVLVGLRIADPAPGETLDVSVDSSDRDGDGRDDVHLVLNVGKQGSAPASAGFVWLDRAAGPARDALEPRQSFESAASALATRAKSKRTRSDVPAAIGNVRRLFSALCAESGTARVFDADGDPLRCGDLGATVDRLAEAEVEAFVGAGDALSAFAALTRADWYLAPVSKTARQKLTQRVSKTVSVLDVAESPEVKASVPPHSGPRLSPLSFEPDGSLLIQSGRNLVRLSADGHSEITEPPAPSGAGGQSSASVVQFWPPEVRSSSGLRWTGATLSCDKSEIALTLVDASGAAKLQSTDLLAPRPGACTSHTAPPGVVMSPIAWHGDELVAVVAGAVVGARPNFDAPPSLSARGTALSPDGHWMVAFTSAGLVVTGKKTELWRLDKVLAATSQLGALDDCVVANDARAVACVLGRRVRYFPRP